VAKAEKDMETRYLWGFFYVSDDSACHCNF